MNVLKRGLLGQSDTDSSAVRHSCDQFVVVISEMCVCVCVLGVSSRVVLVTVKQVCGISRAVRLEQTAKKRLGHEEECWE